MFKMHDQVIIQADQIEDNLTGTIIGMANCIIDAGDPYHSGLDVGAMRTYAVVRLHDRHVLARPGRDDDLISANAEVGELCVDYDNLVPGPWYANVYEVFQIYGGPEEGGWYFNSYRFVESFRRENYDDAVAARDSLKDSEYASTGDAASVVYHGGEYMITIEAKPGEDYDNYQPYE